jgi:hypothetical protein
MYAAEKPVTIGIHASFAQSCAFPQHARLREPLGRAPPARTCMRHFPRRDGRSSSATSYISAKLFLHDEQISRQRSGGSRSSRRFGAGHDRLLPVCLRERDRPAQREHSPQNVPPQSSTDPAAAADSTEAPGDIANPSSATSEKVSKHTASETSCRSRYGFGDAQRAAEIQVRRSGNVTGPGLIGSTGGFSLISSSHRLVRAYEVCEGCPKRGREIRLASRRLAHSCAERVRSRRASSVFYLVFSLMSPRCPCRRRRRPVAHFRHQHARPGSRRVTNMISRVKRTVSTPCSVVGSISSRCCLR